MSKIGIKSINRSRTIKLRYGFGSRFFENGSTYVSRKSIPPSVITVVLSRDIPVFE